LQTFVQVLSTTLNDHISLILSSTEMNNKFHTFFHSYKCTTKTVKTASHVLLCVKLDTQSQLKGHRLVSKTKEEFCNPSSQQTATELIAHSAMLSDHFTAYR